MRKTRIFSDLKTARVQLNRKLFAKALLFLKPIDFEKSEIYLCAPDGKILMILKIENADIFALMISMFLLGVYRAY